VLKRDVMTRDPKLSTTIPAPARKRRWFAVSSRLYGWLSSKSKRGGHPAPPCASGRSAARPAGGWRALLNREACCGRRSCPPVARVVHAPLQRGDHSPPRKEVWRKMRPPRLNPTDDPVVLRALNRADLDPVDSRASDMKSLYCAADGLRASPDSASSSSQISSPIRADRPSQNMGSKVGTRVTLAAKRKTMRSVRGADDQAVLSMPSRLGHPAAGAPRKEIVARPWGPAGFRAGRRRAA
jgi:hypothetical protein